MQETVDPVHANRIQEIALSERVEADGDRVPEDPGEERARPIGVAEGIASIPGAAAAARTPVVRTYLDVSDCNRV